MARRRRGVVGLIPWLGRTVWRAIRFGIGHPQPVIAVALLGGCLGGLWGFAKRSDAFLITEVHLPVNCSLKIPGFLIGQNIWAVELRGLAATLKAQQPSLKRLRVIRHLPNTLDIEVIERTPVAQLKLVQWRLVDDNGFILPQASPTPWEGVVILKGVDSLKTPLKVAQANSSDRLLLALRVVARLKKSPALIGHRVSQVSVMDPQQVSFVIDDGIEIRCGNEDDLAAHLDRLRAVLRLVARQSLAIRYIDVRFKEPVLGPQT